MLFCLLLGVLNAIGGRWADIVGIEHAAGGRLAFRCIIPAVVTGIYAASLGYGLWDTFYIFSAMALGLALWFPWAWDFAAVHGREDLCKWPLWMRKLALRIYPSPEATYKRGTLCMCLRGLYLFPMFVLLAPISNGSLVMGFISGTQGFIYRACGYFFPERLAVMAAEFLVGALAIGFPITVTLTVGIL